jgi:hypothetical protein
MLQRVGLVIAVVSAAVLLLAVMARPPSLSGEEKARQEAAELKLQRGLERRFEQMHAKEYAKERECIERRKRFNPTWAESHIERECSREVSGR